jgi:hypothetical protein
MRGVLLIGCITVGCAHRAVVPPPTTGWRELRSRHFRLRTDLPEGSARTTLEKLESVRWWLQAAWATGGDSPGMTQAIVLGSPGELRSFTEITGLATTSREGPLLVTTGYDGQLGDRSPALPLLAHEIGHELIRRRMPGAPRWYHEGLAGYLESVDAARRPDRALRLPGGCPEFHDARGRSAGALARCDGRTPLGDRDRRAGERALLLGPGMGRAAPGRGTCANASPRRSRRGRSETGSPRRASRRRRPERSLPGVLRRPRLHELTALPGASAAAVFGRRPPSASFGPACAHSSSPRC